MNVLFAIKTTVSLQKYYSNMFNNLDVYSKLQDVFRNQNFSYKKSMIIEAKCIAMKPRMESS